MSHYLKICRYALLPITAIASTPQAEATPKKTPNIIFILADDLGYGEVGFNGQKLIETPNIDALANNGIVFRQHYSGAPVSAPSRCVLMTGQHTGHTYIRGNDEQRSRGDVWSHQAMLKNPYLEGQAPLPDDTRTLGHSMKEAGYTTGIIGKWGLGYPGSNSTPGRMGFDFFYGYNCQRQSHTYYPMFLYRNDQREYLDNAPLLTPNDKLPKGADIYNNQLYERFERKEYSNDKMFDELLAFVNDNTKRPFFMMWTTPLPHVSLQAPRRWVDYYVKKWGDEKPYLGQNSYLPCRYPRATYAAMVSYLDEQIGILIQTLKALEIYDNTLIVFTSDNGPTFNGGTDSPFFNSGGPFNSSQGWGKCSLTEGGIRVPMVISWPDKIKQGRRSDHICAFWDYMPTLCEIAGAKIPKTTDGISFRNEILGKPQKQHQALYWEYPEGDGSKALRMGKWKGIIRGIKTNKNQFALYNLDTDPREQYNLAEQYPMITRQILEIMEQEHQSPQNKTFEM